MPTKKTKQTLKLPHLSSVLKYKNEHVIKRYMKDFGATRKQANHLFQEILKFLWLSRKAERLDVKVSIAMYPEMIDIDNMWHTFLLFTPDYFKFCEKYFGGYLHHQPNTSNKPMPKKQFEKEFTSFLSFTYDHLGEKTVRDWFKSLL